MKPARNILFIAVLLLANAKVIFAPKEELKKISGTNPCPHLATSKPPLIEMYNKTGHRVRCCGCDRNQYLETVCSDGYIPNCQPCPSGTELNAAVHNHEIDACMPIPTETPTAEIFEASNDHTQQTETDNVDGKDVEPTQIPQPETNESIMPEEESGYAEVRLTLSAVFLSVGFLTVLAVVGWNIKRNRCGSNQRTQDNSTSEQTTEQSDQVKNSIPNESDKLDIECETPIVPSQINPLESTTDKFDPKTDVIDEQSSLLGVTQGASAIDAVKAIGDNEYSATIREPEPPDRPPARLPERNSHDLAYHDNEEWPPNDRGPMQQPGRNWNIPENRSVVTTSRGRIEKLQQAETHLLHMKNILISPTNVVQLLNKFKVPVITQERLERKFRQTENDVLTYLHDALKEIRKDSDTFSVEILIEYWRDNGMRALATDLADKMGVNIA